MQKGQTNMVFVFILVAIIMGLVMLFGYMAISKLSDTSSEVEMTRFIQDVQNDASQIKRLRGTTQVFEYRVPLGVSEVCYVTDHALSTKIPIQSYAGTDTDNLFLFDSNLILRSGFVEDIKTINKTGDEVPELCYPAGKIIEVKYEGRGDHVRIVEVV